MTRTTTTHVRRSIALAPSDWAALDALAAQLGAGGRSGRSGVTGNSHPSWRALVRMIARGELGVVNGILPTQGADNGMDRGN